MSDAAEVAEDYRHALEDLSSNMRFEISNLTVIARENTEHALTIAEVLQDHIMKTAPNKKLPSLYVLDSIVKNVGTPYTLYFGRNLFKTFMESYAVVDQPVRRKMEEMLKTWKEPVPGSLDSRPVFSPELVRPIENALMKVRAVSMPQQGMMPVRRPGMPSRDTPTPPGMRGLGAPPVPVTQAYHNGRPVEQVPTHLQRFPQPPSYNHPNPAPQPAGGPAQAMLQPPYQGAYGVPAPAGISIESLNNDIQNLIVATKAEVSQRPQDASVQNRLRALQDLQGIVQNTTLPPDQLELIKNKVTELAVNTRPSSSQPSAPITVPPARPMPATSVAPSSTPARGTLTLDSLLGQGAMAALLARKTATPQNVPTTLPPSFGNVAIRSPQPTYNEVAKPVPPPAPAAHSNPLALLDRLRQAGLLRATQPAAPPPPPGAPASILPPNIASILANAKAAAGRAQGNVTGGMGINGAALRVPFHPILLSALYEDLGPPCTQCGRRFRTDEEGKKKKTAHMDWHFRVHQRSNEAENRGLHRSWYVDQRDWIKSREAVDTDHIPAPEEAAAEASRAAEASKPKYIPVPDPSKGINTVCPICQDKFENKWLDTAQEWVWLDTVLVGNRAYHASCHAEATRDRETTPGLGRPTPETVLGKRKAEVSISSPKVRSLKTSA